MRRDGRKPDELRALTITPHVNDWAEGSVEIRMGKTRLICTASVSETTPKWLNRPGCGWVTAEYGMLPRANDTRMGRDRAFSGGRSQEISRLIGRSLRAGLDLEKLGERQVQVDCDVLQADGGTRTTAITGGFVALSLALKHLKDKTLIREIPLKSCVSAVSVGRLKGKTLLDPDFREDKNCETDMNFVLNDKGDFIEIQGTAEKQPFSRNDLLEMMETAQKASGILFSKQTEIIGSFFPHSPSGALK